MKNQNEVNEIIDCYAGQKDAGNQDNLVAMLREIQETEGCISREVRELIQERMGIKESFLGCILKLYPSLKSVDYSHEIVLCTGERCGNKNSMALLRLLKEELGISKDGISRDGTVRLCTRNCLKQCRTSPNMLVDGELYSQMNQEKVLKLIKTFREKQ
nr:NAD(P)H-dependent oxidoreductase subunit E [uncultured Blautia sp.]